MIEPTLYMDSCSTPKPKAHEGITEAQRGTRHKYTSKCVPMPVLGQGHFGAEEYNYNSSTGALEGWFWGTECPLRT